ncbi:MAG: HAMP domain-containing protein [bacterium]
MEHVHHKRKWLNPGIKREMQLRIFIRILLIVVISSVISGSIFYLYSNRTIESTYRQFHVQLHNMRQVLIPWTLVALGLGGFAAFAAALFYPQKIAGPIYRLERKIQSIGRGNLNGEIRLRPGDELHDLAREINQMGVSLRERLLSARKASDRLETMIREDLSRHCSHEVVDKLHHESVELRRIFDEFTL